MKPKTKKVILGLGMALLSGGFAQAQTGLQSIVVEKYYKSTAADTVGQGTNGVLPIGSVTYRVYAKMLPGWKFQALYGTQSNTGIPIHTLLINSSTSFFNNQDRGDYTPNNIPSAQLKNNTNALDSWFSVGAAASGQVGVLKTADNGAANLLFPHTPTGMLSNTVAPIGTPLATQDGIIAGAPQTVTFVGGTDALASNVFGNVSQAGNSFSTSNGSVASLSGSVATDNTNNLVLIGQFTTDGVFHFELNVQLGDPSGTAHNYVSSNAQSGETIVPSLTGTFGQAPTISITSPTNGASFYVGDAVGIVANAVDLADSALVVPENGISAVDFYLDGALKGTVTTAPFNFTVTPTAAGTHTLTTRATDKDSYVTTSAPVTFTVLVNNPPTVIVTAPTNGTHYKTGDVVTVTANAADSDGSVASVQFLIDGVATATVTSAPYSYTFTSVLGAHTITAKATDNRGSQTTATVINISVANNVAPTVSITAPAAGPSVTAPAPLTITVNAADTDGTVDSVQFFVDGTKVGSDLTSPYSFNWTSVIGTHSLTAKATDNNGAVVTSSAVSVDIQDPSGAPYKLGTVSASCASTSAVNIPFSKVLGAAANVIGYDLVLHFNPGKVQPTGTITMGSALINPSYATVASSVNLADSTINISISLNNLAPVNASFNGQGILFNVAFAKTTGFTSVDTAVFTVTGLQESYNTGVQTKIADGGKFITYRDNTFNAGLKFWGDNSAIVGGAGHLPTAIYTNNALCNNQSATSVAPDASGNFSTVVDPTTLTGLTFNIVRDIAGSTSLVGATDVQSVVNGYDAVLARKVVVQDPSFVPSVFQLIAMDVNMDGVISAGDVTQLNQRSVLKIAEFKQAWNYSNAGVSNGSPSKDWVFVSGTTLSSDQSYLISANYPANDGIGYSKFKVPVVPTCLPAPVSNPATCPLISNETYTGVMLGDVNGNYQTIPSSTTLRTADKIVLDLTKAVATTDYVDVPVTFVSANNINALDLALQLANEAVSYNSLVNSASNVDVLDNFNFNDSVLRVTSNSLQNFDASKAVTMLRFATTKGKITPSDIKSTTGYLNGNRSSVEVVDNSNSISTTVTDSKFVSVFPVPAGEKVNVLVSQDATVELFDMSGNSILTISVSANQAQTINTQNLAAGVYTLKAYNNSIISFTKVVIAK